MDSDDTGSEAGVTIQNGINGNHEEDVMSDGMNGADDADLFGDGSEADPDG